MYVGNLSKFCVICRCSLNGDNRSDVENVCRSSLHVLEF